jgi:hypothetical protein
MRDFPARNKVTFFGVEKSGSGSKSNAIIAPLPVITGCPSLDSVCYVPERDITTGIIGVVKKFKNTKRKHGE